MSQLFAMKKVNHDMFLGAGGHLFEMARKLRRHETQAEKFYGPGYVPINLASNSGGNILSTTMSWIFIVIPMGL